MTFTALVILMIEKLLIIDQLLEEPLLGSNGPISNLCKKAHYALGLSNS